MKTIEIKLYTFDELSDDAQRRAYNESKFDYAYDNFDEYRATLHEFEKIFDIKVYNYNVDGFCPPYFRYITAGPAADAELIDGRPLRLARYMWNNYAEYILKGKYYSTHGEWIDGRYNYKARRSKITKSFDDCPLTGMCYDYDILQPVVDCLHYKRWFGSFTELIDTCLENFFDAWAADIEYRHSLEFFAETAIDNEWYFTADGDLYAPLLCELDEYGEKIRLYAEH